MGRLEGRTALIVGGGSGIGHAGAFVFICGRRESKLKEASAAISPAGDRIVGIQADVTRDLAQMRSLPGDCPRPSFPS